MGTAVGDLFPRSSGSSSLGVEQVGTEFTRDIRPFGHIHCNSGVLHDPLRGSSGIYRVQGSRNSVANFAFGYSMDGGKNFPFEVYASPTNYNTLSINAPLGLLNIIASGALNETASTSINQTAGTTHSLTTAGSSTENITGNKSVTAANISLDGLTNITFSVLNDTSIKKYKTGAHEAWHWMPSYEPGTGGPAGDGFFPMPHSGQINQMILQARGLQVNYRAGQVIATETSPGDLIFIADRGKINFAGYTRPGITLSGIFVPPDTSPEIGDMYFMSHSVPSGIVAAKTTAVVKAQSLGLATLCVNTGSGIINVSVGSGIAQYLNTSQQSITTVEQNLAFETAFPFNDQNYALGSEAVNTSGQLTIMSPGYYRVFLKVTAIKTAGTTPTTVQSRIFLNGANLLGTTINSFHFTNLSANTASTSTLFNANAGDKITVPISADLTGAQLTVVGVRGASLMIEKIGPRRDKF